MTPSRMHSRLLSATRGFSLIELMVGIVISIICTLGMMAAFSAYESQKRTTTNGSDAQQNGSFSTFMLEREIRTAGSALVQGATTASGAARSMPGRAVRSACR